VHCSRPQSETGFTLIEVLVSITLMAMVAAVVLSAMRSGMLVWDKGTKRIESVRRSRAVLEVLNDQIRGAIPLTYTTKNDDKVVLLLAFEGSSSSLKFISRSSFKDGPDGIPRWVDIRWNSKELTVEERRLLSPDNVPDPTIYWHDTVFRGESCSFNFLTESQPNRPVTWQQEWHYPVNPGLPKAVRLNCVSQPDNNITLVTPLDYSASLAAGLRLR
jgi:prepilin-type N-terminal cleavage/methylation domain-containing protein